MSEPLKRRFEADDKTVAFFSAVRGNYYSQDLYIEKGTILIAKRGRAQVRPDDQLEQAATNPTNHANTGSADTLSTKVSHSVEAKDKRCPFVNELFEVLGWADLSVGAENAQGLVETWADQLFSRTRYKRATTKGVEQGKAKTSHCACWPSRADGASGNASVTE